MTVSPEHTLVTIDVLVFVSITVIVLQKVFGIPVDGTDIFICGIGGMYFLLRLIAHIYFKWFWKPEIDPKYKDLWVDGYEEGVERLKEMQDEESADNGGVGTQ